MAVDFFYTAEFGDARVLAEFFVDNEEREMERLAIGWVTPLDTSIWFGRFHTAIGQWNRKYHHGAYLQTTVFRPSVIEFEDDGGAISTHATGVSVDTMSDHSSHTMHYTLNIGLGPELASGGLKALDILKPGEGEHNLFFTAAISSRSVAKPTDDVGVFVSYVRIPSFIIGIDQIQEGIVGGYANYSVNKWHVEGTLMWADINVDHTGGDQDSSFGFGYIQPEYWLNNTWTLYRLVEGTAQGGDNLYLQQIPAYIHQRSLVGAKYQFTRSQALKFELAALEQYDTRFGQALVQWSAALP